MKSISRRGFLAAATASYLTTLASPARAFMSNDEIRVVVIGGNGIGKTHLDGFPKIPGVKLTGFCDVDADVRGKRQEEFNKKNGYSLKLYEDLRKVNDDQDVDAIVLAIPNHWHGLGTVWGCQAGKDVYTEKPCSHNIWEAGQMAKAAKKYNRIVQVGIQRRSFAHLKQFFSEIHKGELGKVSSVRGIYFNRRASIGKPANPSVPPKGVNHDLWSGPAPTKIERLTYHYDWHNFWDLGNGELGNNGPHMLDLCRWAIGAESFPRKVTSIGGRFVWDDSGETPNSHIIHYDYETAPILFEIRDLPDTAESKYASNYNGLQYGLVIETEGGTFSGFDTGRLLDKQGKVIREIKGDLGADGGRQLHRENFVKAVRSRKEDELNCPVKTGHLSTALCHLGNISHRLGSPISLGGAPVFYDKQPIIFEALKRMNKHLEDNGVNLETAKIYSGKTLEIDPKTETFINDKEATSLLKREYRAPFIVPEEV